jgi:hypothetical protein
MGEEARLALEVLVDLPCPRCVSGGENVDPEIEELVGDVGGDPEPGGRVLHVDHDEVEVLLDLR